MTTLDRIRLLEAERDALRAEVAAVRELMNTYNVGGWTDALGPMQRALAAEAEVAKLKSESADKILAVSAACDDAVKRLRAACAAKDAALRAAVALIRDRVPSGPDLHNACAALEAALSTDAGKGWIDASGAVEAVVVPNYVGSGYAEVPDAWAGCPVKIVRVAK